MLKVLKQMLKVYLILNTIIINYGQKWGEQWMTRRVRQDLSSDRKLKASGFNVHIQV